jgi:hypothetical protein
VPEENRYAVRVERLEGRAWRVLIVDPHGEVVAERTCGHEAEARTYASTVRQHIYWLSEQKFRQYYRLAEPVERD